MRIDDLRSPDGAFHPKKRVGRGHGSGHVKTSGRGTKGQNSRSGGGVRPGFEGGQNPIYRRMPYKRGFTNNFRTDYQILNLDDIERYGLTGNVTPESMHARGAIDDPKKLVKILGNGEVKSALHIRAHKFSESAKAKIEAAGGTAEVID
ncbi:MAG TPA: 50S ribosomal protein L15 [Thermomicrobiales bacterium]|nr:50S ribosomal protein L15 [Thermomicrobiales bacterium]